ncbi:MAG TPA: hypothetical protein PKD80_12840 [Microthrixaceae bacterium]|nr:hypothetical protein [Microthrixaceae bacterium]
MRVRAGPLNQLNIVFASWPDEDEIVAEIWSGDLYVGDVRRRPSGLTVTIRPSGGLVDGLALDDLQGALEIARDRLLRLGE